MKVSLRKKSRWERAIDPIASRLKGKAVTAQTAAKPAARAAGGLVIATLVSAVISALRGQDDS